MKSPRKRTLVWSASLLSLFLLTWFTPPLWLRVDGWVQDQRDRVWAQLEKALGQKVVYQRIAPNVLAALDFQDVRLLADDGATVFQAASIRLSWDWGLLFQGRFAEALRRVQVINASLTLDARRDQTLLEHWSQFFQPSSSGGGTAFGFQIEGFNLTARWTDGVRSMALDRGFVMLSPEGHEWSLRYRGALSWEQNAPRSFAHLTVRGELRSDPSFQNLSLRTEASQIRTSWLDSAPITVQVTVAPDQVTLTKVSDQTPFDVQAVWNRVSNQWLFRGAAENFQPARLVQLKLGAPWPGLAEGTLSGRFSYHLGGDGEASGRASWPVGALPPPLASEPLEVRGAVKTQGDLALFSDFQVRTPSLSASFSGDVDLTTNLPSGSLMLERWVVAGTGTARGSVRLERNGNVVTFDGQNWGWDTLGTENPSGWVEKSPSGWKFSLRGPIDGTPAATFSVDGSFDPKEPRIDASVELIALPLSVLRPETRARFPGLDLPDELWALETTLRGHVEWGADQGPAVSVTSFAFHDPLVPDRLGTGNASWRGRHLELALQPSSWDSVRAGGTLSADLEDGGTVAWALVGTLWSHPFDLKGRWVPSDRTLAFAGQPGVTGVVHQNQAGVWNAELSLEPLEIVPGWIAGFQGSALLDGPHWSVTAQKVTIAGRYPWNQEAFSFRAQGQADAGFLRLDDIVLNDSHGGWTGSAVSSWSADYSAPWAGRLSLASPSKESLALDWVASQADRWHWAVRATGLDVTRAGLPGLESLVGRAALSGTADWNGADVVWNLQSALSEARWGDAPLGFRAQLSGTAQSVAVRGLNLSVTPLRLSDGSVDFDFAQKTAKAVVAVGLRVGTSEWESTWKASGQWSGEGAGLNLNLNVAASANVWAQRSFPAWALAAHWGGNAWNAALSDSSLSAEGSGDGSFSVRAQAPFAVRGEAKGQWSGTTFQVGVQGFRGDLALIKDFVNSPLFALQAGVAEGDFTLGGAWADPEVNGTLMVRGLTATSSFVRLPIGPVDVPVVLAGHRLRVDPVNIGPGPQTWMISGGARLDHLLPEEYEFSVQTDALSVIPVSYQYTGVSVAGGVTGQFVLKGNPYSVTLGGRLLLQDAVVTLRPTPPEASVGEPIGFNVDLTILTGRKVEFLWPNETLPLLRAVTASGQTLSIRANDVASTWSVTGKLALRTGEINYLNRTFVIKEGMLIMQEDQGGFDPRISVRAEWRLREATGPVTIGLRADGSLSGFSPRFDATPFKSPDELQQLVGTTLSLPTDYSKPTNMDTALSLASDVGTSFLLTPFEETVKKNFQLDLFTVKTEILKKSLVGRGSTGNTPLEASDYLDNTRLFFGKYIGDDLFLQGTLAFRRDGSVATQASPSLVVEPEFQMEFQTPFFLLNWTLLPQHPETLFVTDNTVTFRWNWSY